MKRFIMIIMLALVVPGMVFAQIGWTEYTVRADFDGATSVYAIDLDDDGDVDVLGAALVADDIIWWENDGDENFTEHTIDSTFDGAYAIYAIDINGDSAIDVLGAARFDDDITWWENDGGNPPSFTEHTIEGDFDGAASVYAIDLDDDGDVDVLGAAMLADDITWWENDGSTPPSFTEHTIDGNYDGAYSVYAIDLDDDDDVDVLGSGWNAGITWWENDGDENFTEHTIAGLGDFVNAICVYAKNLDNDDDIDVLGTSIEDDDITWWENNGDENFTEHTIDGTFDGAASVYAIDLDDDGDVDVLGAAQMADDIIWWENLGGTPPNYAGHTITDNFDGAASVYAIDLDDDGDVDVLGAAGEADDITWWKSSLVSMHNVGIISIDIPSSLPWDTVLNPHATVKNFGQNTETFSVTCTINPGGYNSSTVSYLMSSDSTQVTFPDQFTVDTNSTYTVTVYTQLDGDENPANDTLEKIIETHDPGIAEGHTGIPDVFEFTIPTISRRQTEIKLALPVATKVDLVVYDALGRLSKTLISERFSAGIYHIPTNLDLPAGVYFYKLKTTSGENDIRKFLIVE